jgi:hypothetical protein
VTGLEPCQCHYARSRPKVNQPLSKMTPKYTVNLLLTELTKIVRNEILRDQWAGHSDVIPFCESTGETQYEHYR